MRRHHHVCPDGVIEAHVLGAAAANNTILILRADACSFSEEPRPCHHQEAQGNDDSTSAGRRLDRCWSRVDRRVLRLLVVSADSFGPPTRRKNNIWDI